MADWMDRAVEKQAQLDEFNMRERRASAAKPLDPGVEGECELCGEHSLRLVATPLGQACAPCRDKRRLQ